ncbi:hypothetical protein NECAME_06608 [Necator americanus]|uniref:Uncharacterized protein n=1 Tax=Necator americanus TaxID=51031 RepID=W2TVG6_NECAM|nr:hypothetical protein NECAME_06608 [Necator americanus]ETN85061.1 hypothetical protein NECAME_06608 [Necator americanus]
MFVKISAQFNIPIPFGNIGLKKNADGNLEIASNEGFNLFGYGGKRNLKLVTGNGTFHIEKEDIGLVNGSEFGGSGAFNFNKEKGIHVGQNVTLGDRTIVGGPGREGNFLTDLLIAIQNLTKKQS